MKRSVSKTVGIICGLAAIGIAVVAQRKLTLIEARKGYTPTRFVIQQDRKAPDTPPAGVFNLVKYNSSVGNLSAYLTPDPGDGKKHPAIVWITGGDCNSIGDVWSSASRDNDQTASAYRKAGIVMMFPSLRGGNSNPGQKEGFLGEVDDVLAATNGLAKLRYVDPARIYLGGHSTGGTLAMLTAECSTWYRAVFAYGPLSDVRGYGSDRGFFPAGLNAKESMLRSPGYWLSSVQTPLWVIEGAHQGNIDSLREMSKSNTNPKVHFIEIAGATHFSSLGPTNELIAEKILKDTGSSSGIALTVGEVNKHFGAAE